MNQANLYNKYNSLQKNDAVFAIENYLRLINWRNDGKENILDIGSGDGDVILNLLLPKFPQQFNKLICTDSSEEMVKFASKRCFDDSKIDFKQMDITSDNISQEFFTNFDHLFSFYCFHWIQDQEKAMRNVFKMMKPGADLLFIFLQNCPIFDIYETLAKSSKWATYMKDVSQYIPPFHHSDNPENEMETILRKIGFVSRLCRVENRNFTYPNWATVTKSVSAVNPFMKRLPQNKLDEYISDYVEAVRNIKSIKIDKCNNNEEEEIHLPYKLFVVYACKPLN